MRDRTYTPATPVKKYSVSQDEIDSIRSDGEQAQILLDNPFLKKYLSNAKQSILELNAKQLVYDASETSESNGKKTTIILPSKKEYTMLAGQYRFIDKLIADLEQAIFMAKELNEKIKSEEIQVEETPNE